MHSAGISCHLMIPAHKSRIVLASNRIFALAPVASSPQAQPPNVAFLLPESKGGRVAITPEGAVFLLDAPSSGGGSGCGGGGSSSCPRKLSASALLPPDDDPGSIGRRCMPVLAHDGDHCMRVAAACLLDDDDDNDNADVDNGLQGQPQRAGQCVVIYFAPPPSLPWPLSTCGWAGGGEGTVVRAMGPRSGRRQVACKRTALQAGGSCTRSRAAAMT